MTSPPALPLLPLLEIRPITAKETTHLRQLVLWPTIPLHSQLDRAYDLSSDTIHIGAFLSERPTSAKVSPQYLPPPDSAEQEPVGILTLARQTYTGAPMSVESPSTQIQLHKFAVHPGLRGLGVGRTMLSYAIDLLHTKYENGNVLLHLDARANQEKFYKLCGMSVLDAAKFEKRGTTGDGPVVIHIKMGKVI